MKRTLGLDLGTNSIGWAIIEQEDGVKKLAAAGSVIFPEGVARVKGNETPAAAERTQSRSTRRLYFRRRMRKQRLLHTLITNGMCPLSAEGLKNWKAKDRYPMEDGFIAWFKMNPYELRAKGLQEKLAPMELGRVLYHLTQRRGFQSNRKGGDQGDQESFNDGLEDKGIAGYNDTKELIAKYGTLGNAGAVLGKDHIAIRKRYFKRGDLITEFTLLWDAQKVFHPALTDKLKAEIGDGKSGDIFFQRPLKGKKGDVGRCTLEPGKQRAPISSIQAELFGVLQTINNIKVDGKNLDEKGRNALLPVFFRRSESTFPIGDIRGPLKKAGFTGTLNYEKWEIRAKKEEKEVKLTGGKTIAHLAFLWKADVLSIVEAFGAMTEAGQAERKKWEDRWSVIYNAVDWADISERKAKGEYVKREGSVRDQRDLKEYATTVWGFDEEQLKTLDKFDPKQGYHSLSTRALGRILPYLYQGIPYHYAVLYANLPTVFKVVHKSADGKTVTSIDDRWGKMTEAEREAVRAGVREQVHGHRQYNVEMLLQNGLIRHYRDMYGDEGNRKNFWNAEWEAHLEHSIAETLTLDQKRSMGEGAVSAMRASTKEKFLHHIENHAKVQFEELMRMEGRIQFWLLDNYPDMDLGKTVDKHGRVRRVDQLYHHSAIDIYPERNDKLGDPKTPGLKNPMVYRALHTLRMVVNKMIDAKLIDRKTHVNIEMARQLNSANHRRAWERYQAVMRKKNEDAEKAVREHFATMGRHSNPTDEDIERMWLLTEALEVFGKLTCVYTGETFGVPDIFNGEMEIEHTWPRSKTVDNSMANKMLCRARYNREIKKERMPALLPNYAKDAMVLGKMLPAITLTAEPILKLYEKYDRIVEACKMRSKGAATKEQKDKAIQERWFNQFFRDYWRTKYEHLSAEEIKPGFKNRQLVATGQISKLARAYMNSYFNRVNCLKPEALSAFRKEWMGESFVQAKDRSMHTHHAVDAAVCAAVDREAFDALAHHYEEHDEKDVTASFDHPWDSFGTDMRALRESALVYHVRKPSIGRTSVYQKKVKLKDGRVVVVKATGDTVRGTLHGATYYGRIKQKKVGTDEYEVKTVIRKTLDHSSFYPFKEADKAKVVDKRIKQLLEHADLEKIKEAGGLVVKVKCGDGFTIQKIKKVRVLEPSVKNPMAIKEHRDHTPNAEHKNQLWVAGGEIPIMAVYENAKGQPKGHVFGLHELTLYLKRSGKRGRATLASAIPNIHPKKSGLKLVTINGKSLILEVGQKVVLYKEDPEEIRQQDTADMNRRTYVIKQLETDGRVRMQNILDARPQEVIEEERESVWNPENPGMKLRFRLSKLKAQFDGIDIILDPLPVALPQLA